MQVIHYKRNCGLNPVREYTLIANSPKFDGNNDSGIQAECYFILFFLLAIAIPSNCRDG